MILAAVLFFWCPVWNFAVVVIAAKDGETKFSNLWRQPLSSILERCCQPRDSPMIFRQAQKQWDSWNDSLLLLWNPGNKFVAKLDNKSNATLDVLQILVSNSPHLILDDISGREARIILPSSTETFPLGGTPVRIVVRHDAAGAGLESFRLELSPGLAAALLLEKLGAGDVWMKRAGPKWFEKIISLLLSSRSRSAIFTIVEIIQRFEDHGVVDVFGKHSQPQIFWSLVAYSGLQKTLESVGLVDQYHGDTTVSLTNLVTVQDPVLLHSLAHYVVYASAAYGWKLGFAMKGTTFLRKITKGRGQDQRRSMFRAGGGGGDGKPPFWKRSLHRTLPTINDMSFFLRRTGVKESDIVAAEWRSDTHRPGYVISRDPERKELVFSIRGTWSFHDVLTDLCCTVQDFSVEPNDNTYTDKNEESSQDDLTLSLSQRLWNWFYSSLTKSCKYNGSPQQKQDAIHSAHHGMLEAAQVLMDLTQDIVERELRKNPGYSLVIVGHSMGGGVGALLGTLWSGRFPVSVFVYGPPCIAPLHASSLIGSHATHIVSVITEGDPFGFISLGHIAELSVALDRLCDDDRLRKRVLQSTLFRRQGDKRNDSWWLLHTMRYLHANFTGEKLYPPGRLLLLKEQQSHAKGRPKWTLQSIPPHYFDHFQVRPSMLDLTKHMPSLYEEALGALIG